MYKISSNPQMQPILKNDVRVAQQNLGNNRYMNDSNKVAQNPQYFKQEKENDD